MARLEDEMKTKLKDTLASGTARAEQEKTKEQEETLRNSVLAMLASKKVKRESDQEGPSFQPAEAVFDEGAEPVNTSPTTSTAAANGTNKLQELKARVEKERKLSSLKARLLAEKAARSS
jgi:hypothetical protein